MLMQIDLFLTLRLVVSYYIKL